MILNRVIANVETYCRWIDFIGLLVDRKNELFEVKEIFGFGNVKIDKECGWAPEKKENRKV